MDGFRNFILRGNVVDLAVAVVIGSVFAAVVTAFVADFITPLIGAFGGTPDFSDKAFTINDSRFAYGDFIDKLLQFLVVAAVVYFAVVRPLSALLERYMPKEDVGPTKACPECLSDIPEAARRCAFCTATVA